MFVRDFNPDTIELNEDIKVERAEGAILLSNLPRNIAEFGHREPRTLLERLQQMARQYLN
ncbi:hypothetical protein [Corynebacterium sp. A21]|uniref:hypothetical protein n=1 Tax=Corynebacterium sp. A21 TaxID=3457318 RepID=UPI003FD3ABD0